MGGENKVSVNVGGGSDDQLANDVARLYAWANVEGVPYRDFSRQRKIQPKLNTTAGEHQEVTFTPASDIPAKSEADIVEPVTPDSPVNSAVHADSPQMNPTTAISEPSPSAPQQTETPPLLRASKMRSRARFLSHALSPAQDESRPVLAVHSLAGGVGKTTLCANLARVLCSLGEQVLLVDASGSGLLPFYFGANDLRPGLRKFVAPGMTYPPLQVIGADEISLEWLDREVKPAMLTSHRVIFDLGPASFSLLSEIFPVCSTIIVPLLPDLNSILTIPKIETSLTKMRSAGIDVPAPYYLFTEFDSNNAMDQQARELVARQCGERILALTIRHDSEVSEAIASRMTVVDHAPESNVSHDYVVLANWLQTVAPASYAIKSSGRWTEQ